MAKDGKIHVKIRQYDSMQAVGGYDGEVKFGKLLKEKSFVIRDFSPIQWVSVNEKTHRLVVRFFPSLREEQLSKPITEVPLVGKDMQVTDSEGRVWAENMNVSDKYVGIVTYQGGLFLSFYPFKGAQPLGVAKGSKIELQLDSARTVTISSRSSFVPESAATTVYALYRSDLKTSDFGSKQLKSSSDEAHFLSSIEN